MSCKTLLATMATDIKSSNIPEDGFDAFVDYLFNSPSNTIPPKPSGSSVGQEGYSDIEEYGYSDDDEVSITSSMWSSNQQRQDERSETLMLEEQYLLQVTSSYLDSITKKRHYTVQYSGLPQSDKDGDDSTWSFSAVGRETVTSDSRDDDEYSISSEVCDPSFGKPSELFRDVMKLEDIGRLKALP